MAGSTELRRLMALALCAVFAAETGCATGGVRSLGARTESVAWFRVARTNGERLWLCYEARVRDRDGVVVETRERAVVLDLRDLDPERSPPIDELPLRWLDPDEIPADARPVRLAVARRGGVDVGFRLVDLEEVPEGVFYAGALTRRSTAGWVWAVYPFALAWDAVAVPFLGVLAVPIFGWTE